MQKRFPHRFLPGDWRYLVICMPNASRRNPAKESRDRLQPALDKVFNATADSFGNFTRISLPTEFAIRSDSPSICSDIGTVSVWA
ncbi:MAG: hypothetical protein WBX38_00475 [Candidatus Sulfotelmatobacter sp.]